MKPLKKTKKQFFKIALSFIVSFSLIFIIQNNVQPINGGTTPPIDHGNINP